MISNIFSTGRQRSVMLVLLLFLAVAAFAVPAKPGLSRLLTLTDGTTVRATLVGDEYAHYWLGSDGKSYQMVAGTNTYKEVSRQAIIKHARQRRTQSNMRRSRRLAPQRVGETGAMIGQKKGLIILVNFANASFKEANDNALYQRIANEKNFSYGKFKGSVHDYFLAQSDGLFDLTFDVVGPVTVSENYSHYGRNDSQGNDQHPAEMIIEALALADPEVNFADYDWDGDGTVEQVFVVYAGKGEADGGSVTTIWPHEFTLTEAFDYGDGTGPQTLDGVTIDTYACGSELGGGGSIAGIGTICHEFSHCLGYPDFYDTDYSGGQGMFEWDLMDTGSYNGDGYRPAGYTSYERWVAGWRTPEELTTSMRVSNMPALVSKNAPSYVIYNPGNHNEYFLLENRQQTGWDSDIPGSGLLILHVDYSSEAWAENTPNDDPSHQRMTWVAADNEYQYTLYMGTKYFTTEGAANDPYPYRTNNSFSKTSTPAAKLYNKNADGTYYLDCSLENITRNSDGTISFSFVGISNVATPTFSPKAGRYDDAQTVTISCATEGATIYYTLDGTKPGTSSDVYSAPLTISQTTTVKAVAVKDDEPSAVATARYSIGPSTSDPTTTKFKRVASTDELEPGMRYIIACGSKGMAAGALNNTYLNKEEVTISNDVATITGDVAVFILEQAGDGWTFLNESTNEYLYATDKKKVAYSSSENAWTLADGNEGVIMTYGGYGTMLYNVISPRFTTYTSNPSATMIQANLYMEYSDGGTTPIEKEDVTMTFTPATASATLGKPFTEPVLTTSPEGLAVTYSSSAPAIATVDATTGKVTLVAAGTTTIKATFEGNDSYNGGSASYKLTVSEASTGGDPTDDFVLVTSVEEFVEGDYLIVYDNGAMNTTVEKNRLQYSEVTPEGDVITTTDAAIIWHIAPSGSYYTIYNAGLSKYAASNGTKNQAQLLDDGRDDNALWTVTPGETFEFVNKGNADKGVNANLRRNGTYGFACYSTSTGGALSLYKRSDGSVTPVVTVAAPVISGTTPFDYSTSVTISCATEGATVYYTLDGTTPTAESSLYEAPFMLAETATVSAIAIKDGVSSTVTTKEFVRNEIQAVAYYQQADGKSGSALKTALSSIIYNRTEKSYDYLWTAFKTTDVRSDGKIWDIYSNITNFVPQTKGSNYSKEGDCYNREHAFPQSWFGSGAPMKTDLHHVFPTDGYVNGRRSNNPYGETNGEAYKSANDFSKLGACTYPGYMGKVFEPNDDYKGDVARAIFYMVTCYEEQLPDWYSSYTESHPVLDGTSYPALTQWQLNMLMEWAKADPVSEKEINRNNAIYDIQHNRNPFVDYPGLEEYIWGSMTTTLFSYDNYQEPTSMQAVTMTFTPASVSLVLGEEFTAPTLTTRPADLPVTYSSSDPAVATIDEATGEVTILAVGKTIITATFEGNESHLGGSASYTLIVREQSSGDEETLLYEGVTGYSSADDSNAVLTAESTALDFNRWASIDKVYAGGTGNAYSNGGCLKLGSSKAAGAISTEPIELFDSGILTFYLKQYCNDGGKLNVTVEGASADATEFTPTGEWTLCTVNISNATGEVVITLETSSKRAYVDEIMLVSSEDSPTTGITTPGVTGRADTWYRLDGDRKPTAKGLYIYQGRLFVIK